MSYTPFTKTSALSIAALSASLLASTTNAATLQIQLVADNYNETSGVWADTSGQNNDTTSRLGDPTLVSSAAPSGASAVRFDGSGDGFDLVDLSGFDTSGGEAFVVVKINLDPPTEGSQTGLWRIGNGGGGMHYPWTNGEIYDDFGRASRLNTGNPTADLTQYHIYNVRASSTEWESRINNQVHYSSGSGVMAFRIDPTLGKDDGNFSLNGDIAEFRFYEGLLTSEERDSVYSSLQSAYLIPEASTAILVLMSAMGLVIRRRR